MAPYLVFLIIAGTLFAMGCIWHWLQGTQAFSNPNPSDGGALWVISLICFILAAATNVWVWRVFLALVALVFLAAVVGAPISWLVEDRRHKRQKAAGQEFS